MVRNEISHFPLLTQNEKLLYINDLQNPLLTQNAQLLTQMALLLTQINRGTLSWNIVKLNWLKSNQFFSLGHDFPK